MTNIYLSIGLDFDCARCERAELLGEAGTCNKTAAICLCLDGFSGKGNLPFSAICTETTYTVNPLTTML